jgi:L-amino acid N-acyltransferase YncA
MNESETFDLSGVQIRAATRDDLPRLTEIYNYYVVHTPITFDVTPWTMEQRISWFEQFDRTGRYRLLVAEKTASLPVMPALLAFASKPHMTPLSKPASIARRSL